MRFTVRLNVVLLFVFVGLAGSAEAQLFKFWQRRRGSSSSSSVVSSRPKSSLPSLRANYDYDQGMAAEHSDKATVFLTTSDNRIPEKAKIEVTVEDLSDASATRSFTTPIDVTEGKASFVVSGLEPEMVYRLKTVVHKSAEELSKDSAIGSVPRYYYFATSSEESVGKMRRKIVMSAFRYYYDFRSGKVGNMDCWAFCRRHSGKHIRGWNRKTHYGHQVPALAEKGPIYGDYVRIPDYHSLLLLAYDKQAKKVWTIEGNYNSSIVIVQRPVNSSWWVSHIDEAHLSHGPPRVSSSTTSTGSRRRTVFRRRRT